MSTNRRFRRRRRDAGGVDRATVAAAGVGGVVTSVAIVAAIAVVSATTTDVVDAPTSVVGVVALLGFYATVVAGIVAGVAVFVESVILQPVPVTRVGFAPIVPTARVDVRRRFAVVVRRLRELGNPKDPFGRWRPLGSAGDHERSACAACPPRPAPSWCCAWRAENASPRDQGRGAVVRRDNGRPAMLASALPPGSLSIVAGDRPLVSCPERGCGRWIYVRRGVLKPHHVTPNVRCPGSGQRITIDLSPAEHLALLYKAQHSADHRHGSGRVCGVSAPPPPPVCRIRLAA